MPFTRLAKRYHDCPLPTTRDDGGKLVLGDEWRCDENVDGSPCGKTWRWSDSQMEGTYWKSLSKG